MIPEDQAIPLGGVSFDGPREEIPQDLGISGVRLAEYLQAIPFVPATFRDQEAPGLLVLQTVKLDQDVDVFGGTHPGHFRDVPEAAPSRLLSPAI